MFGVIVDILISLILDCLMFIRAFLQKTKKELCDKICFDTKTRYEKF